MGPQYRFAAEDWPEAEPEETTELLLGVLTEVANATTGRAPLAPMKLEDAIRIQCYRITDCLGESTENTRSALIEIAALAVAAILALDAPGPPAATLGAGAAS